MPLSARDFGLPESVPCPFCAGGETELHAGFGGQLSVVTYWCRSCRTAFDVFKPTLTTAVTGVLPEAPARKKVPDAEN